MLEYGACGVHHATAMRLGDYVDGVVDSLSLGHLRLLRQIVRGNRRYFPVAHLRHLMRERHRHTDPLLGLTDFVGGLRLQVQQLLRDGDIDLAAPL